MTTLPLAGRCVGITADRRWRNQADLLENLGATVLHGPTLRTVDLSRDETLRRVTLDCIDRPPQYFVGTTGMGISMWFDAAEDWQLAGRLRDALQRSVVIARGAKARSVLRRFGFEVAWSAPAETMEEVVAHLLSEPISSARIALQLFDPAGHPAAAALAAGCGELVAVPVYRWRLPSDPGPATRLVEAACAGAVDAVTFTSQPAVHHWFRIAESLGRAGELRAACNGVVRAVCVGPVCAAAAREEGITDPLFPDPPRLAPMIDLVRRTLSPGGSPVD